jgi:hypothetical protein
MAIKWWTVYVMSGSIDPRDTRPRGCVSATSKEAAREKAKRFLRVARDKLQLVPGCRLPQTKARGRAHMGR